MSDRTRSVSAVKRGLKRSFETKGELLVTNVDGMKTTDNHHVGGAANSPLEIPVWVNDHSAELNPAQQDWSNGLTLKYRIARKAVETDVLLGGQARRRPSIRKC